MKTLRFIAAAAVIAMSAAVVSCNNENKTEEANVEKVNAADMKAPVIATGITDVTGNKIDAPAGTPYIMDFNATWCGPCKAFHPTFEAAAEKYAGQLTFYSVDIDENADLATMYQIEAVPTVIGVSATGEITSFTGMMQPEELDKLISTVLGK